MLIDTHAHLDYPDFAPDFDDVLQRATEAGVTRILTIGTSIESSRRAIELAEKYPNVFAVIGVHPSYAEEAGDDVMTPLRELAKSPRVAAIGETGLIIIVCRAKRSRKNERPRSSPRRSRRRRMTKSRWHPRRRAQEQTGEPFFSSNWIWRLS